MGFNNNKFELFLIISGITPRTIRGHLTRVQKIIGSKNEITEDHANEYILDMIKDKQHPSTINKYIQAIRKYCEFNKLDWQSDVKSLKEPKPVRILLSEQEIEEFINAEVSYENLDHNGDKYKIYWSIIAYSGARPSEILNLTINDIDLAQRIINIRKSKTLEGRSVPISDLYIKNLKSYLNKITTKHIFPNYLEDTPLSHRAILKDLNLRKKVLGITKDIKPYSFRHSFITRLLNCDVPLFIVQDIVGHKKAETTRKYYHGSIKNMHDALKKDSALKEKLPIRELIQQAITQFQKYNLESHKDINPAKLQIAYSKIWESIKDC